MQIFRRNGKIVKVGNGVANSCCCLPIQHANCCYNGNDQRPNLEITLRWETVRLDIDDSNNVSIIGTTTPKQGDNHGFDVNGQPNKDSFSKFDMLPLFSSLWRNGEKKYVCLNDYYLDPNTSERAVLSSENETYTVLDDKGVSHTFGRIDIDMNSTTSNGSISMNSLLGGQEKLNYYDIATNTLEPVLNNFNSPHPQGRLFDEFDLYPNTSTKLLLLESSEGAVLSLRIDIAVGYNWVTSMDDQIVHTAFPVGMFTVCPPSTDVATTSFPITTSSNSTQSLSTQFATTNFSDTTQSLSSTQASTVAMTTSNVMTTQGITTSMPSMTTSNVMTTQGITTSMPSMTTSNVMTTQSSTQGSTQASTIAMTTNMSSTTAMSPMTTQSSTQAMTTSNVMTTQASTQRSTMSSTTSNAMTTLDLTTQNISTQANTQVATTINSTTQSFASTQKNTTIGSTTLSTTQSIETLDVYVLAGQSNAEGYGQSSLLTTLEPNIASDVDGVEILAMRDTDFANYTDFTNSLSSKSFESLVVAGQEANVQWGAVDVPVNDGIIGGSVRQAGPQSFGPEITLGKSLKENSTNNILIVKFTKGGSAISEWNPATPQSLYVKMMDTVNRAISLVSSSGKALSLKGLFWLQGETDALNSLTPNYGQSLSTIIDTMRTDLGVSANQFKVVASEISDSMITGPGTWYGSDPNIADGLYADEAGLNNQLRNFVTSENYEVVSVDGITHRGDIAGQHGAVANGEYAGVDGFHYNTIDYLEIGRRLSLSFIIPSFGSTTTSSGITTNGITTSGNTTLDSSTFPPLVTTLASTTESDTTTSGVITTSGVSTFPPLATTLASTTESDITTSGVTTSNNTTLGITTSNASTNGSTMAMTTGDITTQGITTSNVNTTSSNTTLSSSTSGSTIGFTTSGITTSSNQSTNASTVGFTTSGNTTMGMTTSNGNTTNSNSSTNAMTTSNGNTTMGITTSNVSTNANMTTQGVTTQSNISTSGNSSTSSNNTTISMTTSNNVSTNAMTTSNNMTTQGVTTSNVSTSMNNTTQSNISTSMNNTTQSNISTSSNNGNNTTMAMTTNDNVSTNPITTNNMTPSSVTTSMSKTYRVKIDQGTGNQGYILDSDVDGTVNTSEGRKQIYSFTPRANYIESVFATVSDEVNDIVTVQMYYVDVTSPTILGGTILGGRNYGLGTHDHDGYTITISLQ